MEWATISGQKPLVSLMNNRGIINCRFTGTHEDSVNATDFHISCAEEAMRFDKSQAVYRASIELGPWPHFSIREAFEAFDGDHGTKVFAALMDLQLQYTILEHDLEVLKTELNTDYGDANRKSRNVLEDPEFFARRMHLYHAASNCTLRARAIWDKIMGVLILILSRTEYERWLNKNSRKTAFCNIAKSWGTYGERTAQRINGVVSSLDDNFRTAEAHGTGRLRKWVFATQVGEDDPFEDILLHSNELVEDLSTITFVIRRTKAEKFCGLDAG